MSERTAQHCWHSKGTSFSTAMYGPNTGSENVECCWCGRTAIRRWHEEVRPIKGHGPHATQLVRVDDGVVHEVGASEECQRPR